MLLAEPWPSHLQVAVWKGVGCVLRMPWSGDREPSLWWTPPRKAPPQRGSPRPSNHPVGRGGIWEVMIPEGLRERATEEAAHAFQGRERERIPSGPLTDVRLHWLPRKDGSPPLVRLEPVSEH